MLTKLIVNAYSGFIEVSLWLFLAAGGFWGYRMGRGAAGDEGGVIGAIAGLSASFFLSALIFGAHLILGDIRTAVRNIERNERQPSPGASFAAGRVDRVHSISDRVRS